MLSHLTHSRILSIAKTPIESSIREGSRTIILKDSLLLARIREITTEVEFFYRSHWIMKCGAWIAIQPAIEEAQTLAQRYALHEQSEGEIRVKLQIVERTVSLLEPDRYCSTTLPYDRDDRLERLLEGMPAHSRTELVDEGIWSSRVSAQHNQLQVIHLIEQFEKSGRAPFQCIDEVRQTFRNTLEENS